jgi:hypothetical protein
MPRDAMASAQSAPKMCVTRDCERAPTMPHAAQQGARQGTAKIMKCEMRRGVPEGQRNSREAENTDYAKEHSGEQSTRTIA